MKVFDLDKLDALPHFQKRYEFVNSSGKVQGQKEYRYRKGRGHIYTKARQLKPKFVGKPFDEYAKCLRKYFDPSHGISFRYASHIETIKNTSLGERLINWYGGVAENIYNWHRAYYVDLQGIIQKNPKEKKYKYVSRYSYKDSRLANKKKRIERIRLEILEVSLINNPLLHKYFLKLLSEKNYHESIIHKPEPAKPVYGELISYRYYNKPAITLTGSRYIKSMKTWRHEIKKLQSDKIKSQKELEIVNQKLTNISNSNLTDFYSSNIYLHSIGKECHHF